MTDHKRPRIGTRNAVETAIDLAKQNKSASWDELARNFRARRATAAEAVTGDRAVAPPHVEPECKQTPG